MIRRFILGIVVAAIVFAGTACPASAEPHVLKFADGIDLTTLNPLVPEAGPNYELNYLTMAYLTRYGKGGRQAELLASVPDQRNGGISADGLTITFRLKPNLKWSDGAPLTSQDIGFSIALIQNSKTNSIYRDAFSAIARVDTPNPTTAVLHLSKPYGSAIDDYFSTLSAPLLPKHALDGRDFGTDAYQQLPIGAGPFRYTRWTRGDRVELEANPNYALGRPKLTKIVFKMIPNAASTVAALKTGEIDIWPATIYQEYAAVKDVPGIQAQVHTAVRPALIELNSQAPNLTDAAVRRALELATDRATILRVSINGAGVLSETRVSGADAYQAKIPLVPYDPAAANAALEAAGWKRGPDGVRIKNGVRLQITITAGSGAGFVDQELEIIREDWSKVGIDVQTRRQPLSMMFAPADQGGTLFSGKFDGAIYSVGETKSDGLSTFKCAYIPPNGANIGRLCNAQLDALIAKQDRTYDAEARGKLGIQIQEKLASLVPSIIVALRNEYDVYRDNVTDYHAYPYAYFADPLSIDVTR